MNPVKKYSLSIKSSKTQALIAPLAFVSLALLWCQVGYLTPTVSRAFGGILWLLTVYIAVGSRKIIWLILSALLLFNPYGAVHHPAGLWLLPLFPWAGGLWGRRWMGAAFLTALGGWIVMNSPGWWVPLDTASASLSKMLSGTNLSTAAFGWPLMAMAVAFPLTALLTERRLVKPLIAIIVLILIALFYPPIQQKTAYLLHQRGVPGFLDAFDLHWVLLILSGLVLTVWGLVDPPSTPASGKRISVAVSLLTLAGALLVGWPVSVGAPQMDKTVVFYNQGYLNWKTPVYGYYGKGASGMFGLVPEYLTWRGFNVDMPDSLTTELLNRAGVVVIINLIDPLSKTEEEALHQFVKAGGSLLLLGDHTGLANIRAPSNQVLKPYHIELNFDTAKPKLTGWAGALVTAQHSITADVGLVRDGGKHPGITQIWVGASLKVDPPAVPVIIGRDGFADLGDIRNEKDGYLGDFRYRFDERLGNLVLLAETRAGEGKVLVFGDTSSLQNGALLRSGPWVERVFKYLLSPVGKPRTAWRTIGILLLIAAALVWGFSGGSLTGVALGSLALFIAVSFLQWQTAGQIAPFDPGSWSNDALPRALIDYTHSPRTPLNQTGDGGTWGMQNWLMRSGFLPRMLENRSPAALNDAEILVETAPAKKFSRAERGQITQFLKRGGLLIVSCGTEEFDGSKSLLRDYGIEPIYVPLGPAEVTTTVTLPLEGDTTGVEIEKELTVHFHKAWEVKISNPSAQVLLQYDDRPVMVYVPVGDGGLLFIPDTDFLTNRNLEDPSGSYFEDNILYLRYLLRDLAGGE